MCCGQQGHHRGHHQPHAGFHSSGCSCGGHGMADPVYRSKSREIKILEHRLECLNEQAEEVREILDELKNK